MLILLISALVGLAIYLGARLSAANAQNNALHEQIASLKKQLARSRPGGRR